MSALHFLANIVRDSSPKLSQLGQVLQVRPASAVFLRQFADDAIDRAAETVVGMATHYAGPSA